MKSKTTKQKPYVIIRADRAGVFAGTLESKTGSEVTLSNARRLWCWYGAASLSQLAMEGTKNPLDSKFSMEVTEVSILGVIEIISVTEAAKQNIAEVPVWKK